MAYVSFIDDKKFKSIVKDILDHGREANGKAIKKFNRNVIDPFSILWEMSSFECDFDAWYQSEIARQAQKTLSTQIGMFHQKLLGSVKGWEDLAVGEIVDLVNHKKKIIAEVKNKHNTVTGAKLIDVYKDLEDLVMRKGHKYNGYTAYYVEIVPKKPTRSNIPFTPSNNKKSAINNKKSAKAEENEKIRKIDGASFYSLVTGVDDALEQVFKALPKVIKDLHGKLDKKSSDRALEYYNKAYAKETKKGSKTRSVSTGLKKLSKR